MKIPQRRIAAAALSALLFTACAAPGEGPSGLAGAGRQPPAAAADQRVALRLLDDERHLVLLEMRNFLAVLQTIVAALPREDMKAIAAAARSMGSGAANEIPPKTVAKLPEAFKMLAGGVHTTFDVIALDAEALGDPKHTLAQVSELLQKCNACHGIYQVALDPGPATAR